QRSRNRVSRGREQSPQDEGHQLALTGRQREQRGALQVVGHQIVKPLLLVVREELLHERMAVGEEDVFKHLPAQSSLANRFQPLLQFGKVRFAGQIRELRFETFEIPEGVVVDHADKAVKLQEGILQWRRGQKDFRELGDGVLDRVRNAVGWLIDVPQSVRL